MGRASNLGSSFSWMAFWRASWTALLDATKLKQAVKQFMAIGFHSNTVTTLKVQTDFAHANDIYTTIDDTAFIWP